MEKTKLDIEVFSDPICPWCFIGKKRLEEALASRPDVEARVQWRTFQLNPQMPLEGMDRKTYLETKFGGPVNAERVYANIVRAGQTVGIDFAFDRIARTPNTQLAHRLIRFCQEKDPEIADRLVRSLFESYFLNGMDIGDRDVLIKLAADAGLDPEKAGLFLEGDALLEDVLEEDGMARRLGVNGVPCFIVEGKFAISGAQEAKAFFPLFDLVAEKKRGGSLSR